MMAESEQRAVARAAAEQAREERRKALLHRVYHVPDTDTCGCCETAIPRDGKRATRHRYVLFDSENADDTWTEGKLCFSCWKTIRRWVEEAKHSRVERPQTSDEQQQARLDTYHAADGDPCTHCGVPGSRDRAGGHRYCYVFADSNDAGGFLARGGLCSTCWATVHQRITEVE